MERDREEDSLVSSDLLRGSMVDPRGGGVWSSTAIGPVAGGAELKSEAAIATRVGKRWYQGAISTTENGCGK